MTDLELARTRAQLLAELTVGAPLRAQAVAEDARYTRLKETTVGSG